MSMEREKRCGWYPRISLAACRVNAKMTKTEFANRIGVPADTVTDWETGEAEPELEELRKISEISGVPMNFIYIEDKFEGYKSAHLEQMEKHRSEIIDKVEECKNGHHLELIHIFVSKLCK